MRPRKYQDEDSDFNKSPAVEEHPPTSTTLLEKLRANDNEAWTRMRRLFGGLILDWCRGYEQLQASDRQNVFQEVFCSAFEKIEQFRREGKRIGSFRAWLKMITRSKAIDYIRKQKKDPALLSDTRLELYKNKLLVEPEQVDFGEQIEETEEEARNERAKLNHTALEMIRGDYSERDWQIFTTLMLNKNMKAADLSEEFGMTPEAIRKVKSRIDQRFREDFKEYLVELKQKGIDEG